ncbi:MAG: hypothetical protein U1F43_18540 [Myxococcota bacterium]
MALAVRKQRRIGVDAGHVPGRADRLGEQRQLEADAAADVDAAAAARQRQRGDGAAQDGLAQRFAASRLAM